MKEKTYISKLYNEYVSENMKPSKEYLKLAKEFSISLETLSNGLSDEKLEELNEMYEVMNQMLEKQCEETFVEGYCLGANLALEAFDEKIKNNHIKNK